MLREPVVIRASDLAPRPRTVAASAGNDLNPVVSDLLDQRLRLVAIFLAVFGLDGNIEAFITPFGLLAAPCVPPGLPGLRRAMHHAPFLPQPVLQRPVNR